MANPADPAGRELVEFLVDSGAVYSFVPRDVLARLGIAPHSRQRFRLADGSTIKRDRGDALFFYKNDVNPDERFLLNTVADVASITAIPVTIVLNWQAGLKK